MPHAVPWTGAAMYASSVAALGAGFILDTRVCCYDPDLVASYHAAAPSALATAVRLLGLRPGDLLVAGGAPTPCPLAPVLHCRMLCPHPGQENGHRPLPAPLAPSALFWVCSVQDDDPRLRGPTTLTSKSVAVFPLLTQLDPEAFLPHGVGGGSCLGRAAGAKVGSTKDGGLSGYIPADTAPF